MEPLVTASSINLSPGAVIVCVLFGVAVGLVGVALRRFLMAAVDELGSMGRDAGGWITRVLLRRRPGELRVDPWFCARCRSQNPAWASRCYACDARRADAEAPVPEAETPAGPGAGRAQRRG